MSKNNAADNSKGLIMSEKEKMLAGKIYDPSDKELLSLRVTAHKLCKDYNETYETEVEKRAEILKKLLPNADGACYLQGPVYFDYGVFTRLGKNFYANFNFTVLDVCSVTIGHDDYKEDGTVSDKEFGAPVTIGDNCWIAGNVTILAGAEIGSGCVIGAGSVVAGKIPPDTLAYGNPCRAVRKITENDSIELKDLL